MSRKTEGIKKPTKGGKTFKKCGKIEKFYLAKIIPTFKNTKITYSQIYICYRFWGKPT